MKFFGAITQKINAVKRLNEVKALHYILKDKDFQEYVLDLNRKGQLFEQGVDATNTPLTEIGGGYSNYTKRLKEARGLPTNLVTLFDTGDFYKSFAIAHTSYGFDIVADTLKDDQDLRDRWGNDILGLNDDSKKDLIFYLIPLLQDYIRLKLNI